MRTQNVNSSPLTFQALTRETSTMPKQLFEAIKDAPAIKSFGEKYNATVSCDFFSSSKYAGRIQLALTVREIKPISLKDKVINFFKKNMTNSFQLKTHAVNDEEFIASINRKPENTLFEIYNK